MRVTLAAGQLWKLRIDDRIGDDEIARRVPQSNIDALTGLANRLLFESRLDMARARMKRGKRGFAVLYLDLDGFKAINDALGDAAGDDLLRQFSARLKSAFRPRDVVARFGGDDFAVLVEDLPGISAGDVVAKKIIKRMALPFQLYGGAISLEVSIGIATCAAGQDIGGKLLMQQANAAMHAAKLTPGSFYRSFSGLLTHLTQGSTEDDVINPGE